MKQSILCNVKIEVQLGRGMPRLGCVRKKQHKKQKRGTRVSRDQLTVCRMKYHQLPREQRYAIYLGIKEGKSQRAIARQVNVHRSTVSRELSRNRDRFGRYPWTRKDENARFRRERCPGNRGVKPEALSLLRREDWSPRQIAGYLSLKSIHISHESIYARIRSDESGELRGHCRHAMKYRRHVKARRKTKVRNIPGRVSVHERPPEADGGGRTQVRRTGRWT